MKRSLAVALAALSMVGCGSLAVNVPGPLIESPELKGEPGAIEYGFGIEDTTRYTYTGDASRRPPNLNEPSVNTRAATIMTRGGYSITDWWELGLRLTPGSGGSKLENVLLGGLGLTTRVQILGLGTAPGWKLGIYGGIMSAVSNSSGDQNGEFGAGGYDWKSEAKALVLTAGTSVGYRFPDSNALIYLAASYADQKVSGTIDHSLSDNGSSPQAKYTLADIRASTSTAALGARFGNRIQVGVEGRVAKRSWPGTTTSGGGESTEVAAAASMYFR